jgi:hypothetical protein
VQPVPHEPQDDAVHGAPSGPPAASDPASFASEPLPSSAASEATASPPASEPAPPPSAASGELVASPPAYASVPGGDVVESFAAAS